MRVNLEPDHRFMLAGDRVGKAAERRVELIIVDDVAADQHIAALDQFRESGAHLVIHRHRKSVDRDVGEHRFLLPHRGARGDERSEEHTSELQSLMRISYAVFCLKKKKIQKKDYAQHRYIQQLT